MGIATSTGIIVDFAGPYTVTEDSMAFGWPTKYWQLNSSKAKGGVQGWDSAIAEGAEVYRGRTVKKKQSIFIQSTTLQNLISFCTISSTIYAGTIVILMSR